MTVIRYKIMWFTLLLTFIMCAALIYLLMTGSYTSPLCLDKANYFKMECDNLNIGVSVR